MGSDYSRDKEELHAKSHIFASNELNICWFIFFQLEQHDWKSHTCCKNKRQLNSHYSTLVVESFSIVHVFMIIFYLIEMS